MKVKKPTEKEIEATNGWGTWTKEPSTFPWFYTEKETCYIISGKAEVMDDKGNSIKFETGDWVEFGQGLTCTWKITQTIKKRYNFG